MDLSIVIPAYNESESLPELLARITQSADPLQLEYEIIVVDDGSNDGTFQTLKSLKPQYPRLKALRFRKNYGKSPALAEGFKAAQGERVITMDADLQDDPAEIPALLAKLDEGYDMVSGWKKERHDPITKTVPSKLFNLVTSLMSGIRLHDFNCGLKAYRKVVVESLQVYGELHRFLPVLAHWHGFRVGELVVKHHPRKFGRTKFGLARFFNGFFDLMTVLFLTRFRTTPLHIFGMIGMAAFTLGFLIELYLTVMWFNGHGIGGRPLFFLGILLIIVGIQFVGFGLLAEMTSAGLAENVNYSIKEKIE
ncbi:MAG: glycosyltransferase family 2 protein [Calditrichaeota bacterium]|nr:glycosyltransferase family 2 protein [Calditrichota bacterium]MCB0292535.1 glycosyltransferase family 2 protein [Calditrichota bacterium]MCB0303136.1 glycosyltransferase family 2 protein [Calditrichota bacterium]